MEIKIISGNPLVRTCWSDGDVSDTRFFHVLMRPNIGVNFFFFFWNLISPSNRRSLVIHGGSHLLVFTGHVLTGPTSAFVFYLFFPESVGLLCRWRVFRFCWSLPTCRSFLFFLFLSPTLFPPIIVRQFHHLSPHIFSIGSHTICYAYSHALLKFVIYIFQTIN